MRRTRPAAAQQLNIDNFYAFAHPDPFGDFLHFLYDSLDSGPPSRKPRGNKKWAFRPLPVSLTDTSIHHKPPLGGAQPFGVEGVGAGVLQSRLGARDIEVDHNGSRPAGLPPPRPAHLGARSSLMRDEARR
jgi:hypothetical protein